MKKLITLILFCNLLSCTSAQEYIPLIGENKTWAVGTIGQGWLCEYSENPGRYFFRGDTLINGLTYSIMYVYHSTSITGYNPPYCAPFLVDTTGYPTDIFIREDIATQRVYRYYDDGDELLFDFSLTTGDTLDWIVIDTVYTITTPDGINRRYYSMGTFDQVYMIEGIGGCAGPFLFPMYYFENYHMLMCFKSGALEVAGERCNELLTVSTPELNLPNIKYYPNPVTNILTIELPAAGTSYNISVYNSMGLLHAEYHAESPSFNLDMSVLPAGVYVVRIRGGDLEHGVRVVKR